MSDADTVREALVVALTCTGSWGLGGDPSLCRECAEKVRAALAALDRLADSNWCERTTADQPASVRRVAEESTSATRLAESNWWKRP